MKSYVLHVIRNMPSQGNLEGRYIGRTQSPLPMESVLKLARWKKTYRYPEACAFYASPSLSCVDTLKVLYPQADPQVILEMAECDFGEWENKTAKELQGDPRFASWAAGDTSVAPPGGESGMVAAQRVCMGFEALVQNLMAKGEVSAVLVTHGGAISTLLSTYGFPRAQPWDWMCEPGCGYSLRITPGLWMRSMVLEVFDVLPRGENGERPDQSRINAARQAAAEAYEKK